MEQRGGEWRGSIFACFDISPCAPTSHTPRLSPQVPLCTFAGVTLSSGSKMGLQRFNPYSPSTHPPSLPTVRSTAGGKGGRDLMGGGGGGGGGGGRIPCSIPTNFLISFASMLCPKITPLTYPPYSPSRPIPPPLTPFFSYVGLTKGVKVKLGDCNNTHWQFCTATKATVIIYKETLIHPYLLQRVSVSLNLFHPESWTSTPMICFRSYSACTNQFGVFFL